MEEHHNTQDQEKNLALRFAGLLPTLDIAGDIYWVDLEKNCLRPKGPYFSKRISFNSLENYFSWTQDTYIFTYNKLKHEPEEVDFVELYDIPDSIILVEFPSMERLDPVGYARLHQEDISLYLENLDVDLHYKASAVAVKHTLTQLLQQDQQSRALTQGTISRSSKDHNTFHKKKPKTNLGRRS